MQVGVLMVDDKEKKEVDERPEPNIWAACNICDILNIFVLKLKDYM